jgi:NADPH:quinone reductase-like Zn-dependent oxidoreductase
MKHLVLTQFETPSESVALHDDRDPAPGPGDVLVRMEAAAVNPSDLLLVRGLYFAKPEPPAPLGGEGVGIVVDAGAQADQRPLGKRVVVLPLGSLVADGSLSVPVEATYRLDDYRRALEHADAPKRGGKVLFAFDERQ